MCTDRAGRYRQLRAAAAFFSRRAKASWMTAIFPRRPAAGSAEASLTTWKVTG
jgi:hypothetical protein